MTTIHTPDQIAHQLAADYAAFVSADQHPGTPHSYVYAGAWRSCDRRMVYECSQPQNQPPWPAELLAKFRRGNDRERDLIADLQRIGRNTDPPFKVIGQQSRFQVKDRTGRVVIAGKIDAQLDYQGQQPVVDVKAYHPLLADRIDTFTDLFTNPFTKSGAYQLLSYLYMAGEPFGFIVIDRPGLPKFLHVQLEDHLQDMEAFLIRAERVADHVDAGTLPEYIDDPAECRRCPWYGAVCNPPLTAKQAIILTDPALEAALARREELKAAAKEFSDLDEDVKKALRGVEAGIIGGFQVTGKWQKASRVDLPDDVRRQYTITNPKGRFILDIHKL